MLDISSMLCLVLLISFLDWLRGNTWPEGWGAIKKVLLGIAMSFAMGFTGWELLVSSLLCAASFANGWGAALGAALRKDGSNMGPRYESYWQSEFVDRLTNGRVRMDPVFAMAVRGVWAFLFLLPLLYLNINVLVMLPVMAIAFSTPTLITKHWKRYELMRGALLGMGCVVVNLIGNIVGNIL